MHEYQFTELTTKKYNCYTFTHFLPENNNREDAVWQTSQFLSPEWVNEMFLCFYISTTNGCSRHTAVKCLQVNNRKEKQKKTRATGNRIQTRQG